ATPRASSARSGSPGRSASALGRSRLASRWGRERLGEEPEPVPGEDRVDVLVAVASAREDCLEPVQVEDRLETARTLFGAEAAVEVAADPDVPTVAGELADVVDVVGHAVDRHDVRRRLPDHPPGAEHPGVEGHADDRVALDQSAELLVGELPV